MNTILHFLTAPLNPSSSHLVALALCVVVFFGFGAVYFGIIYLSEEFLTKR